MPALLDRAEPNLVALLVPRWKTLLVCAALGLGAGVAYALVAPAWYEARLAVLPSQDGENSKLAKVAALGAVAGLSPTVSNEVQRIHAVLSSVSVADAVIAKFDLQGRYGLGSLERTRKRLQEHCNASIELKAGIVALTCEDRDPVIARDLAAYFGEVGNQVFERITVSTARGERRFLEEMVGKTKDDVDRASTALREFQERHRVLDLPAQSKAVISAMATLEGDLISKRLQLSYLRGFASADEPRVRQLSDQTAIEERELRRLESSSDAKGDPKSPNADDDHGSAGFFPEALRVPGLRFELEQLLRTQTIQETVYGVLTERLAMARVDEARDTAAFQILDAPTVPTIASRPRGARIAGLATAGGLAAGVVFLLAPTWWRRRVLPVIRPEVRPDMRPTKELGS
jgi:capsule polysaccharide export protein KpsE/RkpR